MHYWQDEANILHTRLDGDGDIFVEENRGNKENKADKSFEEFEEELHSMQRTNTEIKQKSFEN